MHALRLILLLHTALLSALPVTPPASVVIFGPGSIEVQLIAAKLAAQQGYAATVVTDKATGGRANQLMYGADWDAVDPARRAKLAITDSEIGTAFRSAVGCVLCAEAAGIEEGGVAATLELAPRLTRLVLLSAIGGSKGRGGRVLLGEGPRIQRCEEAVARVAAASSVDLSVVRVGGLKGGGAAGGGVDGYAGPAGFGLDSATYYSSLTVGGYPSPSRDCTVGYDKATLGVTVSAGDEIAPGGARTQSTEPREDEVSRINAASALLACLRNDSPRVISLSAARGAVPPTEEEWDRMLAQAQAASR